MSSGPYERLSQEYWPNGARREMRYSRWYRNGPGPKVPHQFVFYRSYTADTGIDAPNSTAGYYSSNNAVPYQWDSFVLDQEQKCRDKLVAKTRAEAAQLGAALGEHKQSEKMITRRAWQLIQAARYLKRGYPFEFFRELGWVGRLPKRLPNRSDPKKAADLWLEWHFGWEPLAKDIYAAANILQAPVPQLIVVRVFQPKYGSPAEPPEIQNWVGYPSWAFHDDLTAKVTFQMGCKVRVSNPNLWKANQLGLVNPAAVAWELVPFSFVVDWFIPVGRFLDSWNDFLGLDVTEPYTTRTIEYKSHYQRWTYPPVVQTDDTWSTGYRFTRDTTIPGAALYVRPYKGISVTRAATAIALLVQQLNRLPH